MSFRTVISTKRSAWRSLFLLVVLIVASCTRADIFTMFVGTYSDGFYAYDFDQNAGKLAEDAPIAKAEMPNPSYLAVDGNRVYAVSEMPDASASVWAWRWGGNGFELLNSQPTGLPEHGEDPCYVSTDGNLLAVANYSGGSLGMYRLREDGAVAPLDSLVISGIGGPDLSRQESPHVHCAVFSPDGVPMKSVVWTSRPSACGTIAAPQPCIRTPAPAICCSTPPARICT